MAARFPLIVDGSGTPAIEEIASGDVLRSYRMSS